MENTSNEAKSYYVWKVTHSYDENANMQIKTITSKLAEEKQMPLCYKLEHLKHINTMILMTHI